MRRYWWEDGIDFLFGGIMYLMFGGFILFVILGVVGNLFL